MTIKNSYIPEIVPSTLSIKNKRDFLTNCLQEKVIPNSTPKLHTYSQHIFPDYIASFMESSIRNLKFQEVSTFEEANKLERDFRMNKHMTENSRKKLRKDINNVHISKLKNKLLSLCRNSRCTNIGHTDLILNLSTTPLKQYESETLKFGLKFATGLRKKHELLDIININYRHTDSDFKRRFIQVSRGMPLRGNFPSPSVFELTALRLTAEAVGNRGQAIWTPSWLDREGDIEVIIVSRMNSMTGGGGGGRNKPNDWSKP